MPLQEEEEEEKYGSPTPQVFIFPLFSSFRSSHSVLQKFLFSAGRTYVQHLPLEKGSARYPYN